MNKIKVYNLKEWIEENKDFEGRKLTVFNFREIAIMIGNMGVLVFDDEGVGCLKKNIESEIKVGLNDLPTDNTIWAIPQYRMKISIKEIIEQVNNEEMEMTHFIKRYNYNDRLRSNFHTVLETINKIGLNSKNYYKSKD